MRVRSSYCIHHRLMLNGLNSRYSMFNDCTLSIGNEREDLSARFCVGCIYNVNVDLKEDILDWVIACKIHKY